MKRRTFIQKTTAASALALAGHTGAKAANEKLNIACIGIGDQPEVTLTWPADGTGVPADWLDGEEGTCLFVGDKGKLLVKHTQWGKQEPKLLPKAKFEGFERPAVERDFPTNHHQDGLNAIRTGEGEAESMFPNFAGPLAESARLGHVAFWAGTKLDWDAKALRAPNAPEADDLIRRAFREGWELG